MTDITPGIAERKAARGLAHVNYAGTKTDSAPGRVIVTLRGALVEVFYLRRPDGGLGIYLSRDTIFPGSSLTCTEQDTIQQAVLADYRDRARGGGPDLVA
jgi:hypothetical protein